MVRGRDEAYKDVQLVVRGRDGYYRVVQLGVRRGDGENRVLQLVFGGEMETTEMYS